MTQKNNAQLPSSYKDPSGFVFKQNDMFYRHVAPFYKSDYDVLMKSGLNDALVKKNWIIPFSDVTDTIKSEGAYKVLQPVQIPFMNFPYEWSFSQLKDAALLTLDICLESLKHDMILKDASAYNVTYFEGRPVFIDSLSFEKYTEGEPWVAYGQFCRHFLGPLLLSAYKDLRFIPLLRQFLDGFPLDFVSTLLPKKTRLRIGILMHLHLHASAQSKYGSKKIGASKMATISKFQLTGLLKGLRDTVSGITLPRTHTQWGEYYTDHNYSETGFQEKKTIIEKICKKYKSKTVLDLGANNGEFSRACAKTAQLVISTDVDPIAVEKNYTEVKKNKETNILPLYLDITNPSGNIGFALSERSDFFSRATIDCTLALALIHHLVITYNLPFSAIAQFFASLSPLVVVEFIPKIDSQVKRLLQNRKDIFVDYYQDNFEKVFSAYFSILEKFTMKDSLRTIYVLKKLP